MRSPLQGLWGVEWSADSHMAFLGSGLLWPRVWGPSASLPFGPCLSHYLPQRPLLGLIEIFDSWEAGKNNEMGQEKTECL